MLRIVSASSLQRYERAVSVIRLEHVHCAASDAMLQDVNANPFTLSSGHIGNRVALPFFTIALADRVAGKSGVEVTFAFTPSAGGQLVEGTKISMNFPLEFFSSSSSPSYRSHTLTRSRVALVRDGLLEITMVGAGVVKGNETFCITVRGMQMGPVTLDNSTGISVLTTQVSISSGVAHEN